MQKTARLVVLSRRALLGILLVASMLCVLPSHDAVAQDDGQEQTWGEKAPPENYVPGKEPNKTGNAYNWRQMAFAGGFMLCMAGFIVWLVRRNPREEDAS